MGNAIDSFFSSKNSIIAELQNIFQNPATLKKKKKKSSFPPFNRLPQETFPYPMGSLEGGS